jgi:hypothetical protein
MGRCSGRAGLRRGGCFQGVDLEARAWSWPRAPGGSGSRVYRKRHVRRGEEIQDVLTLEEHDLAPLRSVQLGTEPVPSCLSLVISPPATMSA